MDFETFRSCVEDYAAEFSMTMEDCVALMASWGQTEAAQGRVVEARPALYVPDYDHLITHSSRNKDCSHCRSGMA